MRIEESNPAAADLLRLCAFLAPDAIPETIITQGGEQLGPLLQGLADNPLALNRAIGVLGAYSLLQRDTGSHTLSVHRLVQAVLYYLSRDETLRLRRMRFQYVQEPTFLSSYGFLPPVETFCSSLC